MANEKILASVGGVNITEADIDAFIEGLSKEQKAYASIPQFRQQCLEQLISLQLYALMAEEEKLDETEEFETMMAGAIDPAEGYHHYFVAYRAEATDLVDVKLVLMDPMFNVVQEESLNHLIKPDFARLTEDTSTDATVVAEETHRRATRQLTKLKLGLRKA